MLIGAGDGRWLAGAMTATLALYLPVVAVVRLNSDRLIAAGAPSGLVALWLAFSTFMLIRGGFLWYRVRSDRWLVLGTD